MSTVVDVIVALVAVAGLGLSLRVYFRDKNLGEETADLQRRMVEIEETRFAREEQQLAAEEEAVRLAEERAHSAEFRPRFAYRDSARSIGRVIARNEGQGDASDVLLEVWGERDGGHQEVSTYGGADYHRAERVQPGESVHYDTVFSLASPQPEDLRYRITWTDGRGEQMRDGRVPSV